MKKTMILKILGFLVIILSVITCDMSYEAPVTPVDAVMPQITTQPTGGSIDIETEQSFTMTFTVAALEEGEGELSYQWFSYTRHIEYEYHTGKLIQNAKGTSYTASFTGEGVYHFYVIITNTNENVTGRKIVSVRSDPVTIVVNDGRNARYPIITKQPTGGSEVFLGSNMTITPLDVTVTDNIKDTDKDESGYHWDITYQWYEARTPTNDNGTLIEGGTIRSFNPMGRIQEVNEPGDYYYFVVVTNTDYSVTGRRVSSVISSPALIRISRNPNAAVPEIASQPSGEIYFIGSSATVTPLTVTAESNDGGTLSYKWYSNTTSSNKDGAEIQGATKSSYTPTISTTTAERYYYYVVITNTNTFATNPTSTTTSKVAELVVISPSTDASKNPNATITINLDDKYQFVRGFGGQDVVWSNFPDYTMADYENMFNPDRLGYNMLRIIISPQNIDINETMYQITNNLLWPEKHRENYYEFVKLVNRYNGYVLASPWSPPMEWKTNNSTNGGGSLRTANYQDYAFYLRNFAQNMYNNGAPIYVISIQNEPNYVASGYEGCEWTGVQMRDFFRQVGRFTKGGEQGSNKTVYAGNVPGYGGGRELPYVLTMNGESANNININNNAMNDITVSASVPTPAKQYIDLIGRHIYGDRDTNYYNTANNANTIYHPTDPREVWMTEYNLNGNNADEYNLDSRWPWIWQFLNSIDVTIRNNHESGYIWWSLKRFYSMIGDGQYGTADHQILPRGWGMAHFAKFANETYRVGVTYSGTLADRTTTLSKDNINPDTYTNLSGVTDSTSNLPSRAVKVMAFVRLKGGEVYPVNWKGQNVSMDDISEINIVMYTPTLTNNTGGYDLGTVKLQLPQGFTIRGATAMRSTEADVGDRQNPKEPVWETVDINQDRNSAYVTLPVSQILSVRFTR
ncbi:glucuronoxylanase xynC [Treponema sp. R8-4-B8]